MLGTSELLEKCFLLFLSLSFRSKELEQSLRVAGEVGAGGRGGLGTVGCSQGHRRDRQGDPWRLSGAWLCPSPGLNISPVERWRLQRG